MSISFPLYDTVVSGISVESEVSVDLGKLIKNIHSLDQDGKNKVYALIRYYTIQTVSQEESGIPFGGCFIDNELVFDLKQFPTKLQHILMEFTRMHIKHMKYAQKIEKIRKTSNE
jgi:hypothetical protein